MTTIGFATMTLGHIGLAELSWFVNLLIAVWLWLFGANVGSFMNVVVYRLPIRSSITLPRSRCPRCQHKIRWFDNVPVLSWLLLRGRCRDCHGPISRRYPLVETLVAVVFVVLAFAEPLRLGANLPDPIPWRPLRLQTMSSLGLLCAYQLLLWCTLTCAALISYDGKSVPTRLFVPLILVGAIAPLVWPTLRPVPLLVPLHGTPWLIAAGDGLAGWLVGASLGLLITASARYRRRAARNPAVLPLAACGLVVGWQAVCALAAGAAIIEFLSMLIGRVWRSWRRVPLTAPLCLLLLLFICFWRQIVRIAPWLDAQATILTFVGAGVVVSVLSFTQSWMRRSRRHQSDRSQATARSARLEGPTLADPTTLGNVDAPPPDPQSLMAQGFDGIHACRADGRIEPEQDADPYGYRQ